MSAVLLDTNVWIDGYMAGRPHHADALALMKACVKAEWELLIASHSLKDFWYLYWQTGKQYSIAAGDGSVESCSNAAKVAAWAATEQIAQLATVVGSDSSDAWLALKMRDTHDDYEDNLVVAAALRAKPRLLVTNDRVLLSHCPVATATPADALKFLNLA